MGRLTIDGHTARDDQFFHVATRTQSDVGQHFVQLWRVVVGGQVAPYRLALPRAGLAVIFSSQLVEGF